MWKTVMESPRPGTRFVALFADGSGASVFSVRDDGRLLNANGGSCGRVDCDWLLEAGYVFWTELPEGFALWGEE